MGNVHVSVAVQRIPLRLSYSQTQTPPLSANKTQTAAVYLLALFTFTFGFVICQSSVVLVTCVGPICIWSSYSYSKYYISVTTILFSDVNAIHLLNVVNLPTVTNEVRWLFVLNPNEFLVFSRFRTDVANLLQTRCTFTLELGCCELASLLSQRLL